jgi:aspartate kinase
VSVLVHKYGGTSVNGPERIRAVAQRIAAARAAGHAMVVVVSAMGHTTDELIALAHRVSPRPSRREMDMLLTTGERVSMALLAMALHDLGVSDTTAVALAAALGRARCEIFTDVDGVFTADPRVVSAARLVPRLGYRSCSALAHLGGRVLHARCVDLAARERVPLAVRSSFRDAPGTEITEDPVESPRVEAVTHRADVSLAIAEGNSGGRGEARGILEAVAEQFPALELVAHEQADGTHGALVWMGERDQVEALKSRFREVRGPGGEWRLDVVHDAGFVSLIGLGLGATEAAKAERALEKAGVPLVALRVTPAALVFRVANARLEDAVRALHAAFLEG